MKKITLFIALAFALNSNAQVLISQNFDTALGWTVAHTAGSSTLPDWTRETAGTSPTCSPTAGAGMAKFNSYDIPAGNSYSLTSPAITFGGLFYNVNFSMYRDSGLSSSADNIQVYYNTTNSLSGATLLKTVNRSTTLSPIVSSNGWQNYVADIPYGVTGTGYVIFLANSDYGNNMFLDEISVTQNSVINDAALSNVSLNTTIVQGTYPITGSIKNNGSNNITSLDLSWQLGSGVINTQSITGLNILPGAYYNFSHSTTWLANTGGQYSINVWVSNTNATTDTNLSNNSILKTGYIVNEIFPRTVVYEEATGTWCQWCPRGYVGMKDMKHYHNDGSFIGIAVHNNDPMTLAAYNSAMAGYISGYPSGAIDRIHSEVDSGFSSIEGAYLVELTKTPLGKISVPDANWNPTTREITFDAISKFALDITNANYNMAAIIVENHVTGTTNYRQVNAYSGGGAGDLIDWEGINWANLPNPVAAANMVYNDVGRALIGGFTGVTGSVPAVVTYNSPYTYSFTHILPTTQNINNIEVVVVLLDNATGQIVNANNFDLGAKVSLATNTFEGSDKVKMSPNPSTGIVTINTDNEVQVKVIDIQGKVVYSNSSVNKNTNLDLSNLQKGVYLVKVTGDTIYATEKLILK